MNDEIFKLAKETKESIQSLKLNHYFEDVPINQDQLLLICEYIVHINNLQPVAWMWPVYHSENKQLTDNPVVSENIEMYLQSHGSPFKVTPLYKLD
ncbi:hypothetical protein [Proteus terrae]|uniref:hypothetical protein n=1 Tax=Proteus terrae TaxID=1574161 RepID=UPI0034D7AFFB